MTDRPDLQKDPGESQSLPEKSRLDRRQLLRLGLTTAPVLMTLASRPAFGCWTTKPSAFCSINTSKHTQVSVSGCSPSWWKTNTYQWPKSYCAFSSIFPKQTATLYSACFPGSRTGACNGKTLYDVLSMSAIPGSEVALAQHCIAALFNAASGRTNTVCDVGQVSTIWSEYCGKGYYEPTAGVKWWINSPIISLMPSGSGGICGYLQTTWT